MMRTAKSVLAMVLVSNVAVVIVIALLEQLFDGMSLGPARNFVFLATLLFVMPFCVSVTVFLMKHFALSIPFVADFSWTGDSDRNVRAFVRQIEAHREELESLESQVRDKRLELDEAQEVMESTLRIAKVDLANALSLVGQLQVSGNRQFLVGLIVAVPLSAAGNVLFELLKDWL